MRNSKSIISNRFKKNWLIYGVTATILIISLVGLAIVILPNALKIGRDILFIISAIYLLASCSFFLWIYLREQDEQFVSEIPKVIEDVKRASREYYRNTAAIEENSEQVKKLHNDIEQEIKGLVESNNSIAKQLIELRQEKGNLNNELDKWNQSSIYFFQLLERSLENEKSLDIQEFINKAIREFELIVNKCGFSRIVPTTNSKFDDDEHEFKDEEQSSDVENGSIIRCDRWGYRSGVKVLQRAQVIVAKKTANNNELEQEPL